MIGSNFDPPSDNFGSNLRLSYVDLHLHDSQFNCLYRNTCGISVNPSVGCCGNTDFIRSSIQSRKHLG